MNHLDVIAKMEELVRNQTGEGIINLLRKEVKDSEEPLKVLEEIKNRLKAVEQFEKNNFETRLKSPWHWVVSGSQIILGHKTLEEVEKWYLEWISRNYH